MAAFVAVALSGCLRFDAALALSADDTVTGEFVIAVEKGTGPTYGTTDREMSQEIWADYPAAKYLPEAKISDYRGGGYVGIVVRFTDEPLATFAPTSNAWGVARVGDEFVVSGPSNASQPATTDQGDNGAFTGDLSQLSEAEFTVTITFPGPIASSNGSIQGKTVTWDLADGPATLEARGSAVETADPAVRMAYIVFALLALGAIAYALTGKVARRST